MHGTKRDFLGASMWMECMVRDAMRVVAVEMIVQVYLRSNYTMTFLNILEHYFSGDHTAPLMPLCQSNELEVEIL